MDKRESTISQIYLLSLDTFMIMTVMGITLGIIFFILNPTLNKGIHEYAGEEFLINQYTLKRVSDKLSQRMDCDNLVEEQYCEIILDVENKIKLEISSSVSDTPGKYDLVFIMVKGDKGKEVKVSKEVRNAIEQIGLGFLNNMDSK